MASPSAESELYITSSRTSEGGQRALPIVTSKGAAAVGVGTGNSQCPAGGGGPEGVKYRGRRARARARCRLPAARAEEVGGGRAPLGGLLLGRGARTQVRAHADMQVSGAWGCKDKAGGNQETARGRKEGEGWCLLCSAAYGARCMGGCWLPQLWRRRCCACVGSLLGKDVGARRRLCGQGAHTARARASAVKRATQHPAAWLSLSILGRGPPARSHAAASSGAAAAAAAAAASLSPPAARARGPRAVRSRGSRPARRSATNAARRRCSGYSSQGVAQGPPYSAGTWGWGGAWVDGARRVLGAAAQSAAAPSRPQAGTPRPQGSSDSCRPAARTITAPALP